MNIVIHSSESLVFRDGRPFGDSGQVYGGSLRWPWPSTVMGAVRTGIALTKNQKFFESPSQEELEQLKTVSARRIVPVRQPAGSTEWQWMFPAPSDALVVPNSGKNKLNIHNFNYLDPTQKGGVDLPWRNWKIPVPATPEKPALDSPALWHQAPYFSWLKTGVLENPVYFSDLGISLPEHEVRIHTAIDPLTGNATSGKLFATHGIRLAIARGEDKYYKYIDKLGIAVQLENTENFPLPAGPCHLGGERKTAFIHPLDRSFPDCPDWFENKQWLRLVLITQGDFGGWAPSWLMPDINSSETSWCKVPGQDIEIRLCSAFIPRWFPVSGWDYIKNGPKATRKMIPAGAVYIIELKNPSLSRSFAQQMWGRPINDSLSHPDGCGAVCIGNISI